MSWLDTYVGLVGNSTLGRLGFRSHDIPINCLALYFVPCGLLNITIIYINLWEITFFLDVKYGPFSIAMLNI